MKKCPQCGTEYPDTTRFCGRDGSRLDEPAIEAATVIANSLPTQAQADPSDPMIGRVIAGRYRLTKRLGRGGMGAVYMGEHISMSRTTAIKILASDLANSREYVARFQREADMASRIEHANAVGIYDFGEAEPGLYYIAMEFIEGTALATIIEREAPLSLERTVRIIRQAADALDAAHQLGIVHRDFKPDNMMVCQKPGRPDYVKVVDFGIAKQTAVEPGHQALTHTGFVLGTPQYMSPEQVAGEPLDGRSDLYSLALVCYEMLSRALPFVGKTPQSQMIRRLLEPPVPLLTASPQLQVPPLVETAIMRALSRYPNQRQSTTVEFALELENAARGIAFHQPQQFQPRTIGQPQPAPQTPPMMANPYSNTPLQSPTPMSQPTPPPAHRPPTPQNPMPVATPITPQPYQQPHGYGQPLSYQQTPPPMPSPYANPHGYPPPQKSKAGLIIFIIVMIFVVMMGGCLLLAVISNQS